MKKIAVMMGAIAMLGGIAHAEDAAPKVSGFVQFDDRAFGDNLKQNDDFLIRRARIQLNGDVNANISYQVTGELAPSTITTTATDSTSATVTAANSASKATYKSNNITVLQDASITYKNFLGGALKAGSFKAPFSQDALNPSGAYDFLEAPAIVSAVAPYETQGWQYTYNLGDKLLSFTLGQFSNQGRDQADNNDAKDLAYRLTSNLGMDGLMIGYAAMSGVNDASGMTTAYKTGTQQAVFTLNSVAQKASAVDRSSVEVQYAAGPIGLRYESLSMTRSTVKGSVTGAVTGDVIISGNYLTLSWNVTGEAKVWNKNLAPAADLGDNGWGGFEVHLRTDSMAVNDSAITDKLVTGNKSYAGTTVGLTWATTAKSKIVFDMMSNSYDSATITPASGTKSKTETAYFLRFQTNY